MSIFGNLDGLLNDKQLNEPGVVLFSSILAASEIAYMIRGKWDACNSVLIAAPDRRAIETAASLLEAEFCYAWDCCEVQVKSVSKASTKMLNLRELLAIDPESSLVKALSVVGFNNNM